MSQTPVFINSSAVISSLGEEKSFAHRHLFTDNLNSPNTNTTNTNTTNTNTTNCELVALNDGVECFYYSIKTQTFDLKNRAIEILSVLIDQLIKDLNLTKKQLSETCLFMGSTSLDIGQIQSDVNRTIWLNPIEHINQMLIQKYNLHSLNFTFSTACTSSANALIYANRLLKSAKIKHALVIGAEFYNKLSLSGFSSLELLSNNGLFAFSKQRDGMILGEGAAALFLSTQTMTNEKLEILEGYSSCDTYSLTATQENGQHIASVIKQALSLANLSSQQIDLIKIHGTASPTSDSAEAQALLTLFGDEKLIDIPPVFGLKPYIGHTLGACGVIEIAMLDQLIQQNFIPQPSYTNDKEQCLMPFTNQQSNNFDPYQFILTNHCGFGGNNAAILLKKMTNTNSQPISFPINSDYSSKKTLSLMADNQLEYSRSTPQKMIQKQVKSITGFEVRRMDSFSLIALETVFALFNDLKLIGNIGLYGVADYFSVELLQSLITSVENQQDIRPFDFISTVGNAANFHVAKQFNITGPNLFLGASSNAIASSKILAQADLDLNLIDYALIIHWQESEDHLRCSAKLLQAIPAI